MKDILIALQPESLALDLLLDVMTSKSSLRRTEVESLIRLSKRFGFLDDSSDGKLGITTEGKEFIKHMEVLNQDEEFSEIKINDETSISITIPPFCLPLPLEIKNRVSFTSVTMKRVVADAEHELIIVTPYLDVPLIQSCFENVVRKGDSVMKILTSDVNLRKYADSSTGNYLLNEIRKLMESRFTRGQIFFMQRDMSIAHAKIFCSDRSLFVTSANIKKDSLSENFEAGLYTERQDIIHTVRDILKHIIEHGSECIMESEERKTV